jgi:hypothetical protein
VCDDEVTSCAFTHPTIHGAGRDCSQQLDPSLADEPQQVQATPAQVKRLILFLFFMSFSSYLFNSVASASPQATAAAAAGVVHFSTGQAVPARAACRCQQPLTT